MYWAFQQTIYFLDKWEFYKDDQDDKAKENSLTHNTKSGDLNHTNIHEICSASP